MKSNSSKKSVQLIQTSILSEAYSSDSDDAEPSSPPLPAALLHASSHFHPPHSSHSIHSSHSSHSSSSSSTSSSDPLPAEPPSLPPPLEFVPERPDLPNRIPNRFLGWIAAKVGGTWQHEPEDLPLHLSPQAAGLLHQVLSDLPPVVLDFHTHVMGLGRQGTGCCVHRSFWAGSCKKVLMGLVYMSAGGIQDLRAADQEYIARLVRLIRAFPNSASQFEKYETNHTLQDQHQAQHHEDPFQNNDANPMSINASSDHPSIIPSSTLSSSSHPSPINIDSTPNTPSSTFIHKHVILAFDQHYLLDGSVCAARTEFYTPNAYIFDLALRHPDAFVPSCSVHPYRSDCLDELSFWHARGVRLVKWLPNAMGMDPSHAACVPFYRQMRRLGMVLLSHCGDEKAVEAEAQQRLGNPLLLRRALAEGVKVIIAHCASLGENADLDSAEEPQPRRDNFALCMRMMLDEPQWEGLLFADISATTLFTRARVLRALLERPKLHARLVNGSDYPLPAIDALVWTSTLRDLGLIDGAQRRMLAEIYEYNPLLFDFATKRCLRTRGGGAMFPPAPFGFPPELDIHTPWMRYLESIQHFSPQGHYDEIVL